MNATVVDPMIVPGLFDGLSPKQVQTIVQRLRVRRYPQGQFIFSTGQHANSLFITQQGLVKVSYLSPDGDAKILDIAEQHDIFGELFLGDARFRIGYAQAMVDCTVYVINEEDLFWLIDCYPQIAMNFMRHLVNSHRKTMARMHALQQTDAKTRLLGTLLYLTRHMCCSENHIFQLNQAITQQDLADMTGLNRSTVSSIINKLRQEGVLGGSGRELLINTHQIEELLWQEGFELLE